MARRGKRVNLAVAIGMELAALAGIIGTAQLSREHDSTQRALSEMQLQTPSCDLRETENSTSTARRYERPAGPRMQVFDYGLK
jgi:hypothetical protein